MFKTAAEIVTLAIVGFSSSGTSAIGLASLTNASNNTTLTTDTWIPLGLFLGGIAMTTTIVWKVATHKTKTDAKMDILEQKVKWLEKRLKK